MNIIFQELKNFSKQNFWVYIMLIIYLFIIWATEKWSILEVFIVFIVHFIWDLCLMMMWSYYAKKNFTYWAISQVLWASVFFLIWIYAIFKSWEWQYFLPNIAFIMWSVKTYYLQVKSKDIKFLNIYSVLIVNFIILLIYLYFWLFTSLYSFIQFIGFCLWSSALILQDSKKRYTYYIIATMIIAIWSFIWIIQNYQIWNIVWTSVSNFLLPLTVVIFFLRNFKKYFW